MFFEAGDIVVLIGGIAHDYALQAAAVFEEAEGVDEVLNAVFGNEAAYEEDVCVRLKAPSAQSTSRWGGLKLGAIGDVVDFGVVGLGVMLLDGARVGEGGVSEEWGEALGKAQVELGWTGPFFTLPVEAIDIDDGAFAREAWNPGNGAVARDEVEADVVWLEKGMEGRDKGVDEGVEVFVFDGGEGDQAHTAILFTVAVYEVGAAVDGDLVTESDQACAKLLGACLETAMHGGHAANA
jgi:hypothetical protein